MTAAGRDAGAEQYDLIIVGGGPAGLSLARALQGSGLRIAIVERQKRAVLADPAPDGRDIALTCRSEQMLQDLDVWAHIPAEEIARIRHAKVVSGRSSYALHFDHRETGKDYLEPIIANHLIRRAVFAAVADGDGVDLIDDCAVVASGASGDSAWVTLNNGRRLAARLLVAADSRFSDTRRRMGIGARTRDFGRSSIVCRVDHELEHGDTAFECFHYGRTLAVLPLSGRQSSVVITLPTSEAASVMAMDDAAFSADVASQFLQRLGDMRLVGGRHIYPLVAVYADRFYGRRFALLGDAAVGMHPVTAHGFNLGLRGAVKLAEEVRSAHGHGGDIGSAAGLRRYHQAHERVARPLYLGTNFLVALYTDDRPPARAARSALLHLGNMLHPARHAIMRQLTDSAA